MLLPPPRSTLFPYTTLFRSDDGPPLRARGHEFRHSTLEGAPAAGLRSEEHTSELQSRFELVCRLLLEKKIRMSKIVITYARTQRYKTHKTILYRNEGR